MALLFGKKCANCILAAHLILVIMGTFAFSVADNFDFSEFEENQTMSSGFFTPTEYTVDWLIENTTMIGKADRHSPSPLRNGTVRTSAPPGVQNAGIFLVQSPLKTIEKTQCPNIRDTILLKLRI
ncbi:MAG: hypothetical protein LBK73_06480 [Treponema sp.]|jgi:hypothetical protein|nr:hypothetical protein [Treponema sp.]